jgi:hypothetical protein
MLLINRIKVEMDSNLLAMPMSGRRSLNVRRFLPIVLSTYGDFGSY